MYLYHYVVYWAVNGCDPKVAVKTGQPWTIQAEKLLLTLAVAVASWHLIERPILAWKDRFRYRAPLPGPSGVGLAEVPAGSRGESGVEASSTRSSR